MEAETWRIVIVSLISVIGTLGTALVVVYTQAEKRRHTERQKAAERQHEDSKLNINLQMTNQTNVFKEKTDNLIYLQEMTHEEMLTNRQKIEKNSDRLNKQAERISKIEPKN